MSDILLLSSAEKEIFNAAVSAIQNNRCEFYVPYDVDMNTVIDIVKIALAENANYFYYDNCQINYSNFGVRKYIKLSIWMKSLIRSYNIEKFNEKAKKIVSDVISPNMSEMQKILLLHNYLVDNITYYDGTNMLNEYQKYHTAYGAIVENCAVCEGISAAYCYLLSLVGVKATVVNGKTNVYDICDHTWNIIESDGKFYHIDITWDIKKYTKFDYFALTDLEMKNRNWNKKMYRKCTANDLNFFNVTKSIAYSDEEFLQIATRQSVRNKAIYLSCPYLSYIKNEDELCNYAFNLISKERAIYNYLHGSLIAIANIDQSIIYIGMQ